MKKFLFPILAVLCLVFINSCEKNEIDGPDVIPERDRVEQQIVDNDSLISYLQTHYYNSGFFETAGNFSMNDIMITELPKDEDGNYLPLPDPEENKLLIDAVGAPLTTTFADIEYEYYILKINEGGGETPDFTDDILINYSGNLLDGEIFDSTVNPIVLDLIQVIPGWPAAFSQFKTADGEISQNEDGTVNYDNYGLGVMFLPSGLAYYSSPPPGSNIDAYSNLIFKFELFGAQDNDHDGDGILSQFEDLNGNSNLNDDDTDEDRIPNYIDPDDDNDGVPTFFEDTNNNGNWFDDDDDNDGVPNYLDEDSKESNQ